MGSKGIVASSAAIGILLQQGIGDTIRVSLTPEPGGDRTHGSRRSRRNCCRPWAFARSCRVVAACPGCGRTTSTVFQELARDDPEHDPTARMPGWKSHYPGVETLNVAVMGCIVNGPGESKHADIGISLPGTGETARRSRSSSMARSRSPFEVPISRPNSRRLSKTISKSASVTALLPRSPKRPPRSRTTSRPPAAKRPC